MIIEECKKIIESMSMNEKRYFKIFINKNIFGSQNKYLLLFNIININDIINEETLKKHVKEQDYSDKNISYDINYLNKINDNHI